MATIYYYSASGNSFYAARRIAEEIKAEVRTVKEGNTVCDDKVIGFVAPVFFWGLPRKVKDFISNLEITANDPYIFAVLTCGGPGFGYLGQIKTLLKEKGLSLSYGTRLISVSNYVPEYQVKDSPEIQEKIEKDLIKIIEEIDKRKKNRVMSFTVINKLIYHYYPGKNSDRFFHTDSICDGCGVCQKVCPVGNITINDKKPKFNNQCEHCLACLHNCPLQAINWKEKTQGKKRYRNPHVSLQDLMTKE